MCLSLENSTLMVPFSASIAHITVIKIKKNEPKIIYF